MEERKVGRPTVMTPEVVNKLEEIFALGGTDLEACFFAGISKQTLYDYQEKNPEFIDRKEALKQQPILKARRTMVSDLDKPESAKWYLEKKEPTFKNRVDVTSKDEKINDVSDEINEIIDKKLDEILNERGNQTNNS